MLNAYSFSAPAPTPHAAQSNDRRLVLERDGRSRSDPLMAKNKKAQDDAAAKAKKQKIILVIGGVRCSASP